MTDRDMLQKIQRLLAKHLDATAPKRAFIISPTHLSGRMFANSTMQWPRADRQTWLTPDGEHASVIVATRHLDGCPDGTKVYLATGWSNLPLAEKDTLRALKAAGRIIVVS